MNTEIKTIFTQVNDLHLQNIGNAERTAENAIKIGVLLHQAKETVGHGGFDQACKDHCPKITDRTCQNYMRLASARLIEHKARTLMLAPKSETVSDLPAVPPLPENAIDAAAYEQARKEVEETFSWKKLSARDTKAISKNIDGKSITDLYRDYGVVRQKEPKVYHPPKPQTPDDIVAAENAQAEELLAAADRALATIYNDITGKAGILSVRIAPKRWKDFLRQAVAVTKLVRPLTKRKLSPTEKKAENQAKAKALLKAVESCQTAIAKPVVTTSTSSPSRPPIPVEGSTTVARKSSEPLYYCKLCHRHSFQKRDHNVGRRQGEAKCSGDLEVQTEHSCFTCNFKKSRACPDASVITHAPWRGCSAWFASPANA